MTSTAEIEEGPHALRYEFEPTSAPDMANGRGAGGRGQLYIDGELVGSAEFDVTVPVVFGIEGLSCGYEFGEAVTDDYHAPFTFTGTLKKVTVDLSGELIEDDEAAVALMMAQQ